MKEYIYRELLDADGNVVGREYGGELTRCKDCKLNPKRMWVGCPMAGCMSRTDEWYCPVGKRKEPKDTTKEVRKQLKDMEKRREMDRKK